MPTRSTPLRSAIQFLWLESAFGLAYETWIGPTYLSGLAGELGVSIGFVTLLTAVPFIGQMGQLFGFHAFREIHSGSGSIRRHTLFFSGLGRALWILPLLAALLMSWSSTRAGTPFPAQQWCIVVAAVACLSSLAGSSSAIGWMAWTRELIPSELRGRFFGIRQRYIMTALILANLLASFWVSWKPGGYFAGFAMVGILAILCGGLSTYLLSRVPELSAKSPEPTTAETLPSHSWLDPWRDRNFRRILIAVSAFHCAVQLSHPYLPYYFTKELRIPMRSVAFWAMLGSIGCFVASGFWGRKLDLLRDPRRFMFITGNLIAATPLIYFFGSKNFIQHYAPVDYLLGGMISAGYGLSSTTLVFGACPKGRSSIYFSMFLALGGLAGATGTFLGGTLAKWLVASGGLQAVWLIASVLRFLVVWTLFRPLMSRGQEALAIPSLKPRG